MKDFLRGTLGRLLQIVLTIAAVILMFSGVNSCVTSDNPQNIGGWALFILGIISACGVFGVRYWLGHIGKLR